jgi:hypothetical protein
MNGLIRSILTLMMLAVLYVPQAYGQDLSFTEKLAQVTVVVKQTVTEWWNKMTGNVPAPNSPERAVASVTPTNVPVEPAVAGLPAPLASGTAPAAPVAAGVNAAAPGVPGVRPVPAPQAMSENPAEMIKAARQGFKGQSPFEVKSEGHASTEKHKSKSGVAQYDFKKLQSMSAAGGINKPAKSIPALDVGLEPEISRRQFSIPDWNWKVKSFESYTKLPSPAPMTTGGDVSLNVPKAQPMKLNPADKNAADGAVTREKIQKIDYKIDEVSQIDLKPFEQMSEDQVKMLVMRILFEKGNKCHVVMGFADDLSSKPEFHIEATHAVGVCAKEFKMNQVAFEKLGEVIKKQDPQFGPSALKTLGQNLPIMYEQQFYELVKNVEDRPEYFADKKANNEIYYRAAKGAFRAGHYKAAEKFASLVEPKSTFGPSAQYVLGIAQYTGKDKPAGRATLEKLAGAIEESSDTNLQGLVNVNTARMDFTAHKYDAALAHFMKVPKDHPLWVQALIEQGWTQLALEDHAGAIGNMYSLHSPYFKVLYQPESFVVRTVGYLNICQYGDAYRTMTKLETDYREWQSKLGGYMSSSRTPAATYETVKNYLRSKSSTDIEGLPYQIVREAARGKDFLNLQNSINDKSDELGLFANVVSKLQKDKENVRLRAEQAKKRAEGFAARLATAKTTGAPPLEIEKLKHNLELEKSRSVPNHYELAILEQSQKAFTHFQQTSKSSIVEAQRKLSGSAGQVLFAHMKAMQSEIARVLENNEFLRYEIFAGSGENIRYQVAGGQTGGATRLPASVKPQKMMNWSFDGEFWEDEIGNYRSSLKNNCPKTAGN